MSERRFVGHGLTMCRGLRDVRKNPVPGGQHLARVYRLTGFVFVVDGARTKKGKHKGSAPEGKQDGPDVTFREKPTEYSACPRSAFGVVPSVHWRIIYTEGLTGKTGQFN